MSAPASTARRPPGSRGAPIDPRVLMRIRNLEFRARVVVEGFWSGFHRSPYHGFSVEFTEYRQYSPGDDPRYLDWRAIARSDRYYVKRFEDETNLRCHLVADQSRSMTFGSPGCSKAEYAATLAATFAYFLHLQGDAVGLLTFDNQVRACLPARHRLAHLRRLMLALEEPANGSGTDLVTPLLRVVEMVRRRGVVLLISDFLAPLDRLEQALLQLGASGHDVALFQVLDPAELTFDFREPALFEDIESGRTLLVDPFAVRAHYKKQMEGHCDTLREMCLRLGHDYLRLTTDQPIEFALFDFLRARNRRARRLRRSARA